MTPFNIKEYQTKEFFPILKLTCFENFEKRRFKESQIKLDKLILQILKNSAKFAQTKDIAGKSDKRSLYYVYLVPNSDSKDQYDLVPVVKGKLNSNGLPETLNPGNKDKLYYTLSASCLFKFVNSLPE